MVLLSGVHVLGALFLSVLVLFDAFVLFAVVLVLNYLLVPKSSRWIEGTGEGKLCVYNREI